MTTESEPTKAVEKSPAPAAPVVRKKKKKKPKFARPLDEREIDTPDKQTLYMLGSLAGLALVLWILAHAGCNYHPPRETRVPRKVTTAELTREPKDAAIELQQRLATVDYKGALEIAAGPLAAQLQQEKSACDKDKAACDAKRAANKEAITYGVVLTREPTNAKVRVVTHRLQEGVKKYLTLVERDASGWKITARIPDEPGATLPAPSLATPFRVLTPTMGGSVPGGSAPPGNAKPGDQPPASNPPGLPPGHP